MASMMVAPSTAGAQAECAGVLRCNGYYGIHLQPATGTAQTWPLVAVIHIDHGRKVVRALWKRFADPTEPAVEASMYPNHCTLDVPVGDK